MSKKTIRVSNVQRSTQRTATGAQRVILSVGGHRYLTSTKVLASNGIDDPFSLRGKSVGIEVYEPGEQMVNGDAYEQREDTTLIKSFTSLPEKSQQELVADSIGRAYLQHLLATSAPAPVVRERELIDEDDNGAMDADLAPAAAVAADENMPF